MSNIWIVFKHVHRNHRYLVMIQKSIIKEENVSYWNEFANLMLTGEYNVAI